MKKKESSMKISLILAVLKNHISHLPRILAGSGYTAVASQRMGKPWEPQELC